jgi:predicted dehydrogenase
MGFFANRRMCPALAESETETITALMNRRLSRAEEFCRTWGGKPYDSFVDLCRDPDVDIVYVAVPNHLHAEAAEAAFAAGKPVLMEKPLAGTLEDAERIISARRKADVPLLMGFVTRFLPAVCVMRKLLAEGVIGTVSHARFQLIKPLLGDRGTWRLRSEPEYGGGVLLDLGSHAVDLFEFLLDDRVAGLECLARSDLLTGSSVDQTSLLTLRFERGPLASVELSFATQYGPNTIEIHGSKGSLINRGIGTPNHSSTVELNTAKAHEVIESPGPNAFRAEAEYFSTCLREGKHPEPDEIAGLHNLQILLEAKAKARIQ